MRLFYDNEERDDGKRKKAFDREIEAQKALVDQCLDLIPFEKNARDKAERLLDYIFKTETKSQDRLKYIKNLDDILTSELARASKKGIKIEFSEDALKDKVSSETYVDTFYDTKVIDGRRCRYEVPDLRYWMKTSTDMIKTNGAYATLKSTLRELDSLIQTEENILGRKALNAEFDERRREAEQSLTTDSPSVYDINDSLDTKTQKIEELFDETLDASKVATSINDLKGQEQDISHKVSFIQLAKNLKRTNIDAQDLCFIARNVISLLPEELLEKGKIKDKDSDQAKVLSSLKEKFLDKEDIMDSYTEFFNKFKQYYLSAKGQDKLDIDATLQGAIKQWGYRMREDDNLIDFFEPSNIIKIVNSKVESKMVSNSSNYLNKCEKDTKGYHERKAEIKEDILNATKYMGLSDLSKVYLKIVKARQEHFEEEMMYGSITQDKEIKLRQEFTSQMAEIQEDFAIVLRDKLTIQEKKEAEDRGISQIEYVCQKYFSGDYQKSLKGQGETEVEKEDVQLTAEQKKYVSITNPQTSVDRKAIIDFLLENSPSHRIAGGLGAKNHKYKLLSEQFNRAVTEEEKEKIVEEMEKLYPVNSAKFRTAVNRLGVEIGEVKEEMGRR